MRTSASACACDALRDGDRRRPRRRASIPIAVVATDRHDVDDERRSGRRRSPALCRGARRLAARRRRVRRRHGDAARAPRALRRLGARRLDRRQSAQVAVRAVRSQRLLLPADGRRAADASRSSPTTCGPTKATRGVRNLMDTGIQLGRRFRALKLWMVLRHFGAERPPRGADASTCGWRALFAGWVDADPHFERVAPVPFSVVCFRARPREVRRSEPLDALQRAAARCGQCHRRGLPVPHAARRRDWCCGSPSATSHDARRTSRARGSCCSSIRPSCCTA